MSMRSVGEIIVEDSIGAMGTFAKVRSRHRPRLLDWSESMPASLHCCLVVRKV